MHINQWSAGGGYAKVCASKEGYDVAKWMSRRGVATCVLHYRLPNNRHQIPLQDVHNAFRYCRTKAAEWGFINEEILGKKDALGIYRNVFSDSLDLFLKSVRKR